MTFMGLLFSDIREVEMIFGGGYNKYEGNHFGKVIWARRPQAKSKIVIMTIMLKKMTEIFLC
jgi:hypothetical protein